MVSFKMTYNGWSFNIHAADAGGSRRLYAGAFDHAPDATL